MIDFETPDNVEINDLSELNDVGELFVASKKQNNMLQKNTIPDLVMFRLNKQKNMQLTCSPDTTQNRNDQEYDSKTHSISVCDPNSRDNYSEQNTIEAPLKGVIGFDEML